ncbi:MAG: hypothetical protein MN733_40545 [Nitrososphaera sp.]|nr:hypothetical protein [Nitrososphaera sp.]
MIFSLQSLRVERATVELEVAKAKLLKIQTSFSPHRNVPVRIFRDGSRWVCLYQSHPDIMKCVVAYGDSPAQACFNFDNLWLGIGTVLEEPEEQF